MLINTRMINFTKKESLDNILGVFSKTVEKLKTFQEQVKEEEIDLILEKNKINDRLSVIDKEYDKADKVIKNINTILS